MENSDVLSPRVREYGLFSKELLRPQRTAQNATELINTLGSLNRALGVIDRDVAKIPDVRNAADTLNSIPSKEKKINAWEKIGWRTVDTNKDGTPVNEKFATVDAAKEREELLALKQKAKSTLHAFVREHHGYIFNLAHTALGKNQTSAKELDDLIIAEIARNSIAKKRGLHPQATAMRHETMRSLGKFLVEKSSRFRYLNSSLDPARESSDLFNDLHDVFIDSSLQERVAQTSEENRIYNFRQWLITTGQKALVGEHDPVSGERKSLKIYPTPYYESLLKMGEFLGRKENGIGGSIYTGPPGTGKTRLGVLSNQMEGFDTRVIQIHHYSTFIDLIGERTVQLGLDKSTSYQTRLEAAKNWFRKDPEKAVQGLRDFYLAKHASGVVLEESFEEFIKNFIVTDRGETIDLKNDQDIQKGFERYLDYQMAGASLGLETGSIVDEWVNGELLLAMSQGKRALLDELDKAGPYSLGGLLTLLSQSPGEKFTVGAKTVTIPSWFRIDATANVLSLSKANSDQTEKKTKEYLYDRFNVIPVEYPPIRDDLMIAAVRLSDGAGNLKITPEEQWQIIGVYAYIIPALRQAYESNTDMAPVSHRLTAELCSFLVNPQTKERTAVSVEQALTMALSKIQSLSDNNEQGRSNFVKEIIKNYFGLYQKPSERPVRELRSQLVSQPVSAKIVDEALALVLQSPLMRAIANYQVQELPFPEEKSFQLAQLSPEQQAKIKESMERRRGKTQADLGFELTVGKTNEGYQFTLMGDSLPVLATKVYQIDSEPHIQTLSADAKTALIRNGTDNDEYFVIRLSGKNPSEVSDFNIPEQYANTQMSADGKYLVANGENGSLYICPTEHADKKESWYLLIGYQTTEFQLSQDGQFLLTEDLDRRHSRVFDLKRIAHTMPDVRINADLILEGESYDFAEPNLIVKRESNQAVLINPKTDLDVWLK